MLLKEGSLPMKKKEELNLKPGIRTRKHNDVGPVGLGMDLNTSNAMYNRAQNLIIGNDRTLGHQEKLKLFSIPLLTEARKHSL